MKLIIGLGNPEKQYDGTRHNIGFRVLDEFATSHDLSWRLNKKFHAEMTEYTFNGTKVLLAKPTTYYNLVGESAHSIIDFYKIDPGDVLIIHDELDMPFGALRTRAGGGDAGNNGIRSITQHLGTDFKRIRIGIANDLIEQIDAADFVLSRFNTEESKAMAEVTKKAHELINDFLSDNFSHTTI